MMFDSLLHKETETVTEFLMILQVEEVNRVMGQELGFPDQAFSFRGNSKVTANTGTVWQTGQHWNCVKGNI